MISIRREALKVVIN